MVYSVPLICVQILYIDIYHICIHMRSCLHGSYEGERPDLAIVHCLVPGENAKKWSGLLILINETVCFRFFWGFRGS